jgi:hypothetical protein
MAFAKGNTTAADMSAAAANGVPTHIINVSPAAVTIDEFAPRPAQRSATKLRLALDGITGAGKTFSALLIAFGLGQKVCVIDTENNSADLYAHLGKYDVIPLKAPWTAERYLKAIKSAESRGYDVIIIDSFSHAWAMAGGMLDRQNIAAKKSGNSYTAWRDVTPMHDALVEAILQSNAHMIVTMRSKMGYTMDTGLDGKTSIKKLGLAPIQRDGVEYEFTIVFDIGQDHMATVSKDRTSMFDGTIFIPTVETGQKLKKWLELS